MQTNSVPTTTPLVWVLQTARAGDSAQARALSEALGWRSELKTLRFNGLYHVPNRILGASLVSLSPEIRSTLQPPWPDLVIGVARRTVPAARWIRQQSGGHTKLVQLGRPRLDPSHFDLVISTPQYGVPQAPNVLHLPVPVHSPITVAEDDLSYWSLQFADLPRPWTGIVLGGAPWPFRFDHAVIHKLARQINDHTKGAGTCLICSSPRTPPHAAAQLAAQIDGAAHATAWAADTPNPYRAILNLADQFVVSGDSASMLGEACASGKPVFIFDLPDRPFSAATALMGQIISKTGLINPPRNMRALHAGLTTNGHADLLGATSPGQTNVLPNQLGVACDRVAGLLRGR